MDSYIGRWRVKPGITGWAQVNGCRSELDAIEKLERRVVLDLEYIQHWSLLMDLHILWHTLLCIFRDKERLRTKGLVIRETCSTAQQ